MADAYLKAKQFYDEQWGNEEIKIHSACVIDVCKNTSINLKLNTVVFDIAGWIHDIGRKDNIEKHHEIGLTYLNVFLQKYSEYNSIKDEISDCILNHRTSRKPTTPYGKIMQLADKLSFYHKNMIEYSGKKFVSK
jgi:HD superfamily phosphodiesterase